MARGTNSILHERRNLRRTPGQALHGRRRALGQIPAVFASAAASSKSPMIMLRLGVGPQVARSP